MGWAKYYEDNMSIYIGRMAMREVTPLYCNRREKIKPSAVNFGSSLCKMRNINKDDSKPEMLQKSSGRKGLKVVFQNGADDRMIRKMQMNGWWWSKSNACWYNCDTNGNRKYAKALYVVGAKVYIVV